MTIVKIATREQVRYLAFHSVGRGCLFAVLAITTAMGGLITWPVTAFRFGALLSMLATAILVLRAMMAPRKPYRRTELWALLRKEATLPEGEAQVIISQALADTYWRFAGYAGYISAGMWAMALLFWLAGSPN